VFIINELEEISSEDIEAFEYLIIFKLLEQTTKLQIILILNNNRTTKLDNSCKNIIKIDPLSILYAA